MTFVLFAMHKSNNVPVIPEEEIKNIKGGFIVVREKGAAQIFLTNTENEEDTHLFSWPWREIILISTHRTQGFNSCPASPRFDDYTYTQDDSEFGCLLYRKVIKDPPVLDLKEVPTKLQGIKCLVSNHPYLMESIVYYPAGWYDILAEAGKRQLSKIPKYSFMWEVSEYKDYTYVMPYLPLGSSIIIENKKEKEIKKFKKDLIIRLADDRTYYASNDPFYGELFLRQEG